MATNIHLCMSTFSCPSCSLSLSTSHASQKHKENSPVPSIASTENITLITDEYDQSSTPTLFDHPCIDDPDAKMNAIQSVSEDDDRTRKIPELIDFGSSSSRKYDEKKITDEQEPELHEIAVELELSIGLLNKKPPMNEKTNMAHPRDEDLDLTIGPRTGPITEIVALVPVDVHDEEALLDDHWKIRKVLTKSDVDSSSRLLLGKVRVREHILPHLIRNGAVLVETEGAEIPIWDVDTRSEHVLVLKTWKTKSYVLKKNWTKDFVNRRSLKENHEIGLRWDDRNSRLEFTLFNGD
ncbi:hypothetical protein BUALT_Bualt13G0053300 [Buddleja alternifolia]|uniref:B3 domain-containing protein n=1 Tax=Buddleja alternifolia TaxID=168488 RepID=A0AAV6WSP9_9LAMI|nr:hypothetical protein BUALT_Bualt13G0053300 [Buddleja alternifolia]